MNYFLSATTMVCKTKKFYTTHGTVSTHQFCVAKPKQASCMISNRRPIMMVCLCPKYFIKSDRIKVCLKIYIYIHYKKYSYSSLLHLISNDHGRKTSTTVQKDWDWRLRKSAFHCRKKIILTCASTDKTPTIAMYEATFSLVNSITCIKALTRHA